MLQERMNLSHLVQSRASPIVLLFAVTLFTSAALLFVVQPMIAKLISPLLGGTAAVWTTSMMFFQAALLVGYLYVHIATRLLGVRRQAMLHVGLLLVSLAVLPIGLPDGWIPTQDSNPIPSLIWALALAVGAPFTLLSASAPMLQTWLASTTHRDAGDPYFLYVPSNAGSLAALLSYPFLVEPGLGLSAQTVTWSIVYAGLAGLVILCGVVLWRSGAESVDHRIASAPIAAPEAHLDWLLRLRWLVLSFAPSSLLLGTTTFITTDIAAVPLLWVIPLALYILTFVIVFARRPPLRHQWMVKLQPFVVVPLIAVMLWGTTGSAMTGIVLHLSAFFVAAMVCHGELVRLRPAASGLTEFYLWMSFGGVLGGVFNAIVAPLAFDLVIEYALALVLVCLLVPPTDTRSDLRVQLLDLALPLIGGAALFWAIVVNDVGEDKVGWVALTAGVAALAISWSARPQRYGLWIAVLLVVAQVYADGWRAPLFRERSFFGVSEVTEGGGIRRYYHGTTLHGAQSLNPELRLEPTTYYTRTGPLAPIMDLLQREGPRQVAMLGLGAGTTACYGRAEDTWYFLEIDPLVVEIATNRAYFSFLSDCPPQSEIVLGDARLSMRQLPDGFDLLAVDTFSSDAIPVHLITREAVEIYLGKLNPDGLLALHVTNRYVDLEPVLADLVHTLGLAGLMFDDQEISDSDRRLRKETSTWVVLARSEGRIASLRDRGWRELAPMPGVRHWTDDFSNIVEVLN